MTAKAHNKASPAAALQYRSVYTDVHAAMSDARSLIRMPRWSSLCRYFSSGSTIRTPHSPVPLPTELLVQIFQYLPATEIALVQKVCRTFRDTVKESSALQFTIEVFLASVVEGPAVSSLSSSRARLDRLTYWKDTRRGNRWKKVWEDASTEEYTWSRRGIRGNTFFTFNFNTKTLQFTTLPSIIAGTSTKTWSINVPQQTVAVWSDPSQEVVVNRSRWQGRNYIVFLHMYTGMPFPGAENNYVYIGDVSEVFHVDVRILGDMIIIYREFGLDREDVAARDVLVYDWKRKIHFVRIHSDSKDQFLTEVAFLDADHLVGIMFTSGSPPTSLVVIPWRTIPCEDISITDVLAYSTVFHFPLPKPGCQYMHKHLWIPTAKLFCEHNTNQNENTSEDALFLDAGRHPPLIMLDMMIEPDCGREWRGEVSFWEDLPENRADLRFVIPGRTLMSRVAALDAVKGGVDGMRKVPWNHWGEDTRVWAQSDINKVCVYGSRMLLRKKIRSGNSNRMIDKMVIYDFDSTESMLRDVHSGDKARSDEIVVEPSYLSQSAYRYLRERVVTKAPYREFVMDVKLLDEPSFGEDCFLGIGFEPPSTLKLVAYSV